LALLMSKAIAQVGNMVLERQLLTRAQELGLDADGETEEELADQAVHAVADYRRARRETSAQLGSLLETGPRR
jgi:hypothetical protein